MDNFPASSQMTDFEIVELGNQYLLDNQSQLQEAQVQATEAVVQNPAQLILPIGGSTSTIYNSIPGSEPTTSASNPAQKVISSQTLQSWASTYNQ